MILDIIPYVVVRSLETGAFMAIVAYFDMLMVRGTQREVEQEGIQGTVAFMRRKKSPRLCMSKFRSKEVYSAESWRIGIARFGGTHHKILRTRLVRNSNLGKNRAISRRYPKR